MSVIVTLKRKAIDGLNIFSLLSVLYTPLYIYILCIWIQEQLFG